jgi:hypothetical protein
MPTLSDEQRLHFYQVPTYNMIGVWGTWSDADISDTGKAERMK